MALPSVIAPTVGVIISIFYCYHFVFKLPFIFRVTVAQSLWLAIFFISIILYSNYPLSSCTVIHYSKCITCTIDSKQWPLNGRSHVSKRLSRLRSFRKSDRTYSASFRASAGKTSACANKSLHHLFDCFRIL